MSRFHAQCLYSIGSLIVSLSLDKNCLIVASLLCVACVQGLHHIIAARLAGWQLNKCHAFLRPHADLDRHTRVKDA